MPAIPPRDEPRLPPLRRFRIDPQDPTVAREVDADGNPVTTNPAAEPAPATPEPTAHQPAGPRRTETQPDAPTRAADDLLESERLLAGLDGSARHTPPRPGPVAGPRAWPPQSRTGPTGPGSGAPAASPADRTTGTPTGPTRVTGTERTATRRWSWPFLATGFAAALVVGLVAWLVLKPTDDPAGGSTGESESGVSAWAAGICTELTGFQTSAMSLRADVAKAAPADSGGTTVDELQRQAAELLSTLGTDLQAVGIPSGSKEASSAHTTIISTVNATAASVKSGGGSGADTTAGTANAILSALDRPTAIFQETVAELPTADRDAVVSQETCTPLL